MHSEIRIFPCADGEIQRVHLVRPDDWSELEFLRPQPSDKAFDCFYKIYRQFLVPSAPEMFGNIVMFRLPRDLALPISYSARGYGTAADPLTAVAMALRRGVTVLGEKVFFRNAQAKQLWQALESRDCVRIVRGKRPVTTVIPVGDEAGFLSDPALAGKVKINSSFFIMDPIDCATPYDHIGSPFGLLVKDGVVESPPLFSREALLVRSDGSVSIAEAELESLRVRIGGQVFLHGENARFYSRPHRARTPPGGIGLVIVGRRVVAVCKGSTPIPASGFVLCSRGACSVMPGDPVTYEGLEDIRFGIQVGNSILRDGVKTEKFISKFYDLHNARQVPFPPSMYPLDFDNARAARTAIGADRAGKPMLLWAEGAAKQGHIPGVDSRGASLADMARICEAVGMANAVNLDGGGSAQILVNNRRSLLIADRAGDDHAEAERPVPMGLVIR